MRDLRDLTADYKKSRADFRICPEFFKTWE
jgi:hypothetical protein